MPRTEREPPSGSEKTILGRDLGEKRWRKTGKLERRSRMWVAPVSERKGQVKDAERTTGGTIIVPGFPGGGGGSGVTGLSGLVTFLGYGGVVGRDAKAEREEPEGTTGATESGVEPGGVQYTGARATWTWTGRALVKKSASWRSPEIHDMENKFWRTRHRSQSNRMSMDFDFFGRTVSVARPIAHPLSQRIGVGGWG